MANIELDAGSGGSIVRTVQKTVGAATVQIATAAIDVGNHATGTELLVGDANVFMPVHGAAADDSAASGNPILVGAKYLASPESDQLDANDVGQLICDINRHLKVVIHGAGGSPSDASVGLAIDDDGAASVTFSGLHTENYRTDGNGTDTTAALGVVVPGLTGAVSVGSVSVTNKTSGTDQPTVVGLNSAVVGAHITDFYTGDSPDDDVVNISAFGLAVPSASGPVVIDNANNKLSVNVSTIPDVQIAAAGNTVKLAAADDATSVIGTVKISTANNTVQNKLTHIGTTVVDADSGNKSAGTQRVVIANDDPNLVAIKTAVQLIDNAVSTDKIAIAGRTAIANAASATAMLVDAEGNLQVDLASDPTVSIDASANTVKIDVNNNAVSLGTDTVHIAGRTDIASAATAKALLVDSAGHLQVDVLSGGGNGDYVYADDADWTASTSKHSLIGGVYQAARGTITDGDTGPVRLTSSGQVHAYLDDVTFSQNNAAASGKVLLAGARSYNSTGAPNQSTWSDGDASSLYVDGEANLRVALNPTLKNGLSPYRSIGISSSYETVSASQACLYNISAFNMTASPLYLKIYNVAAPTSANTPIFTFPIPANASSTGAGFVWNSSVGYPFFTAIGIRVTTGLADNDTTYPSAGDVIMNFGFHA